MYGRGNLLSSLVTKVKLVLAGEYRLPGGLKANAIIEHVKWLLEDSHFKYGKLDLEVFVIIFEGSWLI
jgi:hypothetical protein